MIEYRDGSTTSTVYSLSAFLLSYVPDRNVRGVALDGETRCTHYGADEDVVALRFGCCESYYACFKCHEAIADHPPEPWPADRRAEPAVRCGVCGFELTASEYVESDACANCDARFNPGCAAHYHIYFEWISSADRTR